MSVLGYEAFPHVPHRRVNAAIGHLTHCSTTALKSPSHNLGAALTSPARGWHSNYLCLDIGSGRTPSPSTGSDHRASSWRTSMVTLSPTRIVGATSTHGATFTCDPPPLYRMDLNLPFYTEKSSYRLYLSLLPCDPISKAFFQMRLDELHNLAPTFTTF